MQLNNEGWGKGVRRRFPLPEGMVEKIRAGSHKTDGKYAKEIGYAVFAVRSIRIGQRRDENEGTDPC